MKAEELGKQLADAASTIRALQDELTESNRGLVALHMELDERVQQRTAELAQANESLREEITERKRAEEEMRESEEKYRTLFESIDQGFCTVEVLFDENERPVDYRFLTVNPAFERLTGIQNGVGRRMREIAPFHEEHWFEIYGSIALTGESMRFENSAAQLNRFYEVFAWRVGAPKERRVAILFNDISERKRAALELQEANASLEKRVEERTRELAQRAAQLRALAGELTLSEQRERSRLAKILHDHIQQLLVAAKFRTAVLGRSGGRLVRQTSKEVEDLINESIAASRSLTAELSPAILHEAGLNAGLQWLARRMADTQGLLVDLELKESGPLPEDLKVLLFESVRELLFNVVKHANTRSARVNLRHFDGSLHVTVSDQGVGFDPTAMPAVGEEGAGFGLFSIRERLELMGGTFEIESNPGQGSRFILTLPIAPPP